MRKKIMIAVDQSVHSRNAMAYAVQVAEVLGDVDFDLYHVQPVVSSYLTEEARKDSDAKDLLERVCERNRQAAEAFLEDCRKEMAERAKGACRIGIVTRQWRQGVARDITLAAENGAYDALVVGRRGITGLQELFMGSVTSNLLTCAKTIPLWVVDGHPRPGGVLVAVDGSPASLRGVDHAAHMLSEGNSTDIGFVNIVPRLGDFCELETEPDGSDVLANALTVSNEKCLADFSRKAYAILENAGIEKDRVSFFNVKQKLFTGKAVLKVFQEKGYGSLVVGKSGFGNSPNMGRVATYLVQKLSNGAVWMVP